MGIALLFAALASLAGVVVVRALKLPLSLAPISGVALLAVLTTWSADLGLPPMWRTASVGLFGLAGAVLAAREANSLVRLTRANRGSVLLLGLAVALPLFMLGVAFSGVEAPVSTHDGAFHVETIDKLRTGTPVGGWYPIGFHANVAAILGLTPWIDTARGSVDAALGLSVLTPLVAFGLALALDLDIMVAAIAAVVVAVTWQYPYDFQLWSGWPQGLGVLLLLGLCASVLRWLRRPTFGLASIAGLLAGAIVLTHGTEVYSAVLAIVCIAIVRWRRIDFGALARHAPLAAGLTIACTAPYLSTLLGWAGGAGEASAALMDAEGRGDWLQFALGVTGAGSLLDLPVRIALIALGLYTLRGRVIGGLWGTFVVLLLVNDVVNAPLVAKLFTVTYPWLDHDRPRQVAVVFASLLCAGGVFVCLQYLLQLRVRLAAHPATWRRLAMACALVAFFFAEGSGVSIYKRVVQGVLEQNVYTADDAAAMAWLHAHVQADEVVANDLAGDAGIWAPYKADVQILLPRSAAGSVVDTREPVLQNLLSLNDAPAAERTACALHVDYLFHGAAPQAFDERLFPDRSALEEAPDLQEVFAAGEAAVFRIQLPCE
jgi:uncharacterized protein DUF6541